MTALRGYRVLELAEGVAGEYCGKLLSDFGAEVVKIERPGSGSPVRALGPFGPEGGSALFAYLNTNKRSVALDLAQGDDALQALLGRVDVVLDDHAPGWLEQLGLDPAALQEQRPALVTCSITPYGRNPPADRIHAEDLNVFHASGWGYHNPSGADDDAPPLKAAGRYLVSYEAGLDAALCVVAALFDRERSGRGRFIEISKQQVMASRTDYVLAQMVCGDMDVSTSRRAFDLGGPSMIFPCRDGAVYFWISDAIQWGALSQLMGAPAWMDAFPPHWLEREVTPERVATCRREITAWLAHQDRNAVSEAAQKLGLMMVAINQAPDLMSSPQFLHRKFFAEVDHPGVGKLVHPTVPYKLSLTPAAIETPAPALGRHTADEIGAPAGGADRA
jgi:crotonobetainyl-CoA:carnitine CoA-transferase CaiB-like acyl-CoA transferase